jgi:hypothetical protein
LKTNGFEPVYNIYKKDDKLIIRVEGKFRWSFGIASYK